jgi:uncharacterized protein YpmB
MFGTALSFIGGLIPSSVKSYANIIIIVVILALVGGAAWKYKSAIDTIAEMEQQRIELEKEKALLQSTNDSNQEFIKEMQADLEKKEKVVTDFRIQKARDDKKLSDLSSIISSYNASQDGPIAKVLKDAIIGIQRKEPAK